MSEALPELKSVAEFLFEVPLYAEYTAPLMVLRQLYGKAEAEKFDAFCPQCAKHSTFTLIHAPIAEVSWMGIGTLVQYNSVKAVCARSGGHTVTFWFRLRKMNIQKVGQYPSLADIANDEVAVYRSSMSKQDGQEFHKAVGLAAHGVGVGSFVYLRRVFERLIYQRFSEFKQAEGWDDDEFAKLRMSEKITFLKGHLPDFLVENANIYSILSTGIHELDEKECLAHFELLKTSIIMILDEDKRKKEQLALKARVSKALKGILTGTKNQETEAS